MAKKRNESRTDLEWVATDSLTPAPTNFRIHTPTEIKEIETSIQRHGFVEPIVVDSGNTIVHGHARWEAAKNLGLAEVPVIRCDSVDGKAAAMDLNMTQELATDDFELLNKLIVTLEEHDALGGTGLAEQQSFLGRSEWPNEGAPEADELTFVDYASHDKGFGTARSPGPVVTQSRRRRASFWCGRLQLGIMFPLYYRLQKYLIRGDISCRLAEVLRAGMAKLK